MLSSCLPSLGGAEHLKCDLLTSPGNSFKYAMRCAVNVCLMCLRLESFETSEIGLSVN